MATAEKVFLREPKDCIGDYCAAEVVRMRKSDSLWVFVSPAHP